MPSNFADVAAFHEKFELLRPVYPTMLPQDVLEFRYKFMKEELSEFADAAQEGRLDLMADALVDLVYVAMGTAVMMGIPWQLLWDEVQRANMSKVRAKDAADSLQGTGRGHAMDVIKPPDFVPPRIQQMLNDYVDFLKGLDAVGTLP